MTVAGFPDGLHEHIERFVVVLHTWRKASFVANIAGTLTILRLGHALQVVIHLGTDDIACLKVLAPTGRIMKSWQALATGRTC